MSRCSGSAQNLGYVACAVQSDRRWPKVTRPLDLRLRDDTVLDEIEMTSNLIIAASEMDRPLTQYEVDAILGLG